MTSGCRRKPRLSQVLLPIKNELVPHGAAAESDGFGTCKGWEAVRSWGEQRAAWVHVGTRSVASDA